VFYAQIAKEEEQFSFDDLPLEMLTKHEERMPTAQARSQMTADEVNDLWEARKREKHCDKQSVLDDVIQTLPALQRAYKIQSRASSIGFDWPDFEYIFEKLEEESHEVQDAMHKQAPHETLTAEIGDLIFTCVNIARRLDVDPEYALRKTCEKFDRRFRHVERYMRASDDKLSFDKLLTYWDEAKTRE